MKRLNITFLFIKLWPQSTPNTRASFLGVSVAQDVAIIALLSSKQKTSFLLKNNELVVNGVDDLLRFPNLTVVAEKGSAKKILRLSSAIYITIFRFEKSHLWTQAATNLDITFGGTII